MIQRIQNNTEEGTWTEDQLNSMDTDMLRRIEKSVRKVDYSGQGGSGVQENAGKKKQPELNANRMVLPPGVEIEDDVNK